MMSNVGAKEYRIAWVDDLGRIVGLGPSCTLEESRDVLVAVQGARPVVLAPGHAANQPNLSMIDAADFRSRSA